uniref:XPA C-terminal domain-containing protein n=1 Tax=Hyaloperonospora arabidopsidis (strain Emoy2) TaxID=559515 RepID=M4BZH9_HYAAE
MPPPTSIVITDVPVGRCVECNDDALYLDRVLLEHFSLRVCITCKQLQTLRDGAFELLSKSRAQAEYALPASSFRGLPYLSKPNPRHEAFAPLQLFLRRTLVQEAYRLYGDNDGLEREKHKRKKRAFQSAASRTRHLLKRQHLIDSDSDSDREGNRDKKKKEVVLVVDNDHRHEFGLETFDDDTKSWTKHCACGMHVQFEKW